MMTPLAPGAELSRAAGGSGGAWRWPGIIVGLLALQGSMSAVTAYLAFSDATFATEPDYYRKSMEWDAQAAAQRADSTRGWLVQLDAASRPDDDGQRLIRVLLRDRAGQPIDDAHVRAEAFAHARASERTLLTFAGGPGGAYQVHLPSNRSGLWEFRLSIERGKDSLRLTRVVDVGSWMGNP